MAAVHTAVRDDAGPKVFELTYEDTKITYVPAAEGGVPRLHYEGPMGEHTFEGDAIQTFRSARGQEVSVTLERFSILRENTLTVFLPDLDLDGTSGELSFRTVGIHSTRHRRAIAADAGELTSQPLELEGLARSIQLHGAGSTVLL